MYIDFKGRIWEDDDVIFEDIFLERNELREDKGMAFRVE